jgi:hypothetical protein
MAEELTINGRCLCGAVEVTAQPIQQAIGACHCRMCRRWASGPYMGIECHDSLSLRGEAAVTTFQSSEWAYRAFCNQCGSHLFFRMNDGSLVVASSGLFDLDEAWQLTDEVFMEDKPGQYAFTGTLRQWLGDGEQRWDA